ncbi:MAG TPA: histidine kinase, partial [Cyclobacteriaceae bacterium]|nr:histidine kinase [Cyclobacteriaceae bacterium]
AVKHNVATKQQAVQVTIRSTPDGYIIVENNLNKKARSLKDSTGIGLANIKEKYRLLNRNDVTIEETADKFKVTLPLLA